MDSLIERSSSNLPSIALAEVFDRLIWCEKDNGGELCEVIEKWLKGNCKTKCKIALEMKSTYPFETIELMKVVFKSIIEKWPELEVQCESISINRVAQNV
ncbi:MAG: hypothetical protein HRU38_25270 [Saccharospirillaceae bacterium]|nr:hypothetical protein [Saccharospirillaceae bacterium]